jgi:hypothetical protein
MDLRTEDALSELVASESASTMLRTSWCLFRAFSCISAISSMGLMAWNYLLYFLMSASDTKYATHLKEINCTLQSCITVIE